jgi:hypothetical protein
MFKQMDDGWVRGRLDSGVQPLSVVNRKSDFILQVRGIRTSRTQRDKSVCGLFTRTHLHALVRQNGFPPQQLSTPAKLNIKHRNR